MYFSTAQKIRYFEVRIKKLKLATQINYKIRQIRWRVPRAEKERRKIIIAKNKRGTCWNKKNMDEDKVQRQIRP